MILHYVILVFLGLISGILCKSVRIYGGRDSDIRDFPYIVTIRHYVSNGLLCAGSIIGRKHVISSAHCFMMHHSHLPLLRIYSGTSSASKASGSVYKVDCIDFHPEFKSTMNEEDVYRYDLAIITIRGMFEYNEFQNRIELPVTSHRLGEVSIIAGWGRAHESGPHVSETLQSAYTSVLDMSTCVKSHPFIISYEQICVYNRPGVGICMGDSGSPLVSNGILIGVASFGVPCATGISDIYTNVFHCIDFIRSIVPYERTNHKKIFMIQNETRTVHTNRT